MQKSFLVSFVVSAFVTIAAILSSLAVFDALSWDEVTDNLSKLAIVGLIVLVASYLISSITSQNR